MHAFATATVAASVEAVNSCVLGGDWRVRLMALWPCTIAHAAYHQACLVGHPAPPPTTASPPRVPPPPLPAATPAAVPGMVAGMLRHLRSLRGMKEDNGAWGRGRCTEIHTCLAQPCHARPRSLPTGIVTERRLFNCSSNSPRNMAACTHIHLLSGKPRCPAGPFPSAPLLAPVVSPTFCPSTPS